MPTDKHIRKIRANVPNFNNRFPKHIRARMIFFPVMFAYQMKNTSFDHTSTLSKNT